MHRRRLTVVALLLLTVTAVLVLWSGGRSKLTKSGIAYASVQDGLTAIAGVDVPAGNPRDRVTAALRFAVTFIALASLVAVIAAGVLFIVGGGSENAVQRGRKIIIYTVIGLLVVFFASVIVGFFTKEIPT